MTGVKFFKYSSYPGNPIVLDLNVEDFLMQESPSGIYLIKEGLLRLSADLVAVNYGSFNVDKPVRAFQKGESSWSLDSDAKIIAQQREGRNMLFDQDKIGERVLYTGTLDDLFYEFKHLGYSFEHL